MLYIRNSIRVVPCYDLTNSPRTTNNSSSYLCTIADAFMGVYVYISLSWGIPYSMGFVSKVNNMQGTRLGLYKLYEFLRDCCRIGYTKHANLSNSYKVILVWICHGLLFQIFAMRTFIVWRIFNPHEYTLTQTSINMPPELVESGLPHPFETEG